ncbi:MAG TPA: T9SS type A sorting domain-containing protein [Bacteroidales bacterium]|nr:T9SS type A sorting domain-containing protein [Bacteroidales bacterium]HPS74697.1 T9SS type A sorting domain-containing protein [Bacteroidales bacterium]
MRHKRLKLCAVLLLGLGLSGLQAQVSVDAAGGNASGSGGSASYSVGQMVCSTHTGTNGSVTQGVQQPYEISVITAIKEVKDIHLLASAYPNPVNSLLTLCVNESDISNLSYKLHDMHGKLLQKGDITETRTLIEMGNLVPSTYFLTVTQNNQDVKTFKIVKK